MNIYKKSLIPISGLVYGQIIYWLTIVSSLCVLFGTIVSFLENDSPLPASYLLSSVIDGKSKSEIWEKSVLGSPPDFFFFLNNFSFGESITMIGIAIGVSSVIPATFFASYFLWKSRNPIFSLLALLASFLTCIGMSGLML